MYSDYGSLGSSLFIMSRYDTDKSNPLNLNPDKKGDLKKWS